MTGTNVKMPNKDYPRYQTSLRGSISLRDPKAKRMSRRRSQRLATIPGVKEDAAHILEKFLQSKLAAQSKKKAEAGRNNHGDLDKGAYHKQYLRNDSYRKASVDDILFEHCPEEEEFEKEDFRVKTSSLPSSYRTRIVRSPENDKEIFDILKAQSEKSTPIPQKDNGKRKPSLVKTGSVSSSDTESEGGISIKGRKKKSLFTRTKERLQQAFRKESSNVHSIIDKDSKPEKSTKKPNKAKKKYKQKSKDKKDSSPSGSSKSQEEVVHVRSHKDTNIEQKVVRSHGSSDKPVIIRTESTVETVVIEDDGVQMRNGKKNGNGKESDNGFHRALGRIRKSFSRRRSTNAKDNISASRSAEPMSNGASVPSKSKKKDNSGFQRTNSEPASELLAVYQPAPNSSQKRKTFSGRTGNDKKAATDIFDKILSKGTPRKVSESDIDTVENGDEMYVVGPRPPPPPPTSADRHTLKLEGLSSRHAGDYKLRYQSDYVDEYVKKPYGKVQRKSRISQGQTISISGIDSPDDPGGRDIPFEDRTEEEKEEMYDVIARKLADIADNYVESDAETPNEELTSLEKKIMDLLRVKGDQINDNLNSTGSPALDMMKNASYNAFQSTVQNVIGHNSNVEQIAMLFHLTKHAVQIAGAGGALANRIKENTLRYFEDKFAAWIVGQGGWDSMIEETDSELD